MKSKIFLTVLSLLSLSASAQDTFSPILSQIEQNSTTLQTLQKQFEAQKTSYRVGLTPRDPEVQFGYLFGSPSPIGDRKDVSIRQEFDFPSVYARRNHLANQQGEAAEWQYRNERMQLLLKAQQTCIRLVYNNALARLYQEQALRARKMTEAYEQMLQQGTTNQLELDKARLHRTTVEGRLSAVCLEQSQLSAELQAMNGGQPIALTCSSFDELYGDSLMVNSQFSIINDINEAEQHHPALLYMQKQKAVADAGISVARTSSLPKWSVGYMGEFVRDNTFQGVTVGISIPLWENKNRVRQARQQATAVSQQTDDVCLQYRTHLHILYEQAIQLKQTIAKYDTTLSNDGLVLLNRAFEKGELSLLNYLLEQDYWTTAYERRLQTQRDLALVLAELNAWKL